MDAEINFSASFFVAGKRRDAKKTQRRKGNAETQRKRREAKETQRSKGTWLLLWNLPVITS